ncbi:MAG: SPRY domain-containing protein [Sinimarinibacterium flocculans]|uniref:SPRY domain-containing protein n=1 Tax=Sinimarinibacterium flocculans TaxID=985250 RepID=UPI003C34AC43
MTTRGHHGLLLPSAGGGGYSGWNPADKDANTVLSESNFRATAASNFAQLVRSVAGKTDGKWYVEFVLGISTTGVGVIAVGAANESASLAQFVGQNQNGWGHWGQTPRRWHNSVATAYGTAFANNDVIGMALDLPNNSVWWSRNGEWQGGGNPAAGTGAAFTSLSGTIYLAASCWASSNNVLVRTDPATQASSAPASFTAGWPD